MLAQPGVDAAAGVHLADCLLAFSGGLEAAASGSTSEALDWVKKHAGEKNTRYCKPGDLLPLPGVSGVRIYVLGPPHDEDLIHQSAPSRSHPETYLLAAEEQLRLALNADAEGDDAGPAQPFDEQFRLDQTLAQKQPFFQKNYGFGKTEDAWRRVDTDWQGLIGPLALQLDSDTNNTSLAIAIELLPSRQVLLFPGDAQVGNWLSWQTLEWTDVDGGQGSPVTVKDLFARTVLYKVGHHGSHNATLREQGLELMTSDKLLAMLPVVETFAHTVKHWQMPWPALYQRLLVRTKGRILRPDQAPTPLDYAQINDLFIEASIPSV